MNEEIRKYVNTLFEKAPNTKRMNDLKDEIVSNANDKYNDLIKDGKEAKEAYNEVTVEIGDVEELIQEINKNNPINEAEVAENSKKTAFVVATAVGLYILSLVSVIVLAELQMPDFITVSSLFIIAGIATCMLVYHFISRPKYSKYDETMVEEFKQWKNQKDKNKEVRKSISSILWTLTLIIYLFISFAFGIWYISWIVFIIAGLVESVIDLLFKLKA